MKQPKLASIDSIYIPVKNREQSMVWFIKHFALEIEGDHLKVGNTEFFFLQTIDNTTTNFLTNAWDRNNEHYEMPAFCFRTTDITDLYNELKQSHIILGELIEHEWFKEFDFFDIDNNKFKVWEPNNHN